MRYLFFISWLRAREKKLADSVDIDRMIGASSSEESFRVLNDTDYAPYIANKTHFEVEEVIKNERRDFQATLERMGMDKDVLSILFLSDGISLIAKNLKEGFFEKKQKESVFPKDYREIAEEIEKNNPESPEKIDDMAIEIYFRKAIELCAKKKEKEAAIFFKEYWEKLENSEDKAERDKLLSEMEDQIIEKSKNSISGILPILSFFIKKRKIERFIRAIFSGKRIGLSSSEIRNLITSERAL